MKLSDFINAMEKIAPFELALDFDNVGLLVGTCKHEINKALIALDCTMNVANEAVLGGYDLILTHHPLLFHPTKQILPDSAATAAIHMLIRNDIALFSAHTNYDAAAGGVNDVLCELLGVNNTHPLPPENIGRVGELIAPCTMRELMSRISSTLNTSIRYVAGGSIDSEIIHTVLVAGGACADYIPLAREQGIDCFITGEIKHNNAVDAVAIGQNVIVAGHYETENPSMVELQKRLSALYPEVEFVFTDSTTPYPVFTQK